MSVRLVQWFRWGGGILLLSAFAAGWWTRGAEAPAWTEGEILLLRSLWIGTLPPIPPDPANAVADDPRAAEFGRQLFFDTRLSGNGEVACATCHQPQRNFTDGLPRGSAIGESKRNTRSIVGSAFSPWQYWDGRKDSLWSQALSPLEDPREHGGNRLQLARLVAADASYRKAYTALFGDLPDLSDRQRFPDAAAPAANAALAAAWQSMAAADQHRVTKIFVNLGKSIAAYERLLVPGGSRFDAYVQAVVANDSEAQWRLFSAAERRGLRLFLGKANCLQCHNGPLFTNNEFHNTGLLPFPGELPDKGRAEGVRLLLQDPFNCLGRWSDGAGNGCAELRFARREAPELLGAIRTPSLRNLAGTEPFMHQGQFNSLGEVLDHYNRAPAALIGHNELKPLRLGRRDLRDIEHFLGTLHVP